MSKRKARLGRPPRYGKRVTVSVRLPVEVAERLDKFALKLPGRPTRGQLLASMIEKWDETFVIFASQSEGWEEFARHVEEELIGWRTIQSHAGVEASDLLKPGEVVVRREDVAGEQAKRKGSRRE